MEKRFRKTSEWSKASHYFCIETPSKDNKTSWRHFSVFIINLEYIQEIKLCELIVKLNMP